MNILEVSQSERGASNPQRSVYLNPRCWSFGGGQEGAGCAHRTTATGGPLRAGPAYLALHVPLDDLLHQHVGQGLEVHGELLVLVPALLLLDEQLEEGVLLPAGAGDVGRLLGDTEQLPQDRGHGWARAPPSG